MTLKTNGKSAPPSVNFSFMSRDCINLNREALGQSFRKNPNRLLRVATPLMTFEGSQDLNFEFRLVDLTLNSCCSAFALFCCVHRRRDRRVVVCILFQMGSFDILGDVSKRRCQMKLVAFLHCIFALLAVAAFD